MREEEGEEEEEGGHSAKARSASSGQRRTGSEFERETPVQIRIERRTSSNIMRCVPLVQEHSNTTASRRVSNPIDSL